MFLSWLLLFLLAWANAQSTSTTTPSITLTWGTHSPTYSATLLPHNSGNAAIWKFQNVRFAQPPTGTLRFGAPATPTGSDMPSDPTGAIQCWNYQRPSSDSPGRPYLGEPSAGDEELQQSEDCLFLDVYVPASVLANGTPSATLPVIVWFFGGAYILGTKGGADANNPLYTGVGVINAAKLFQEDVIFVAGNYRLGAFGWLAGSYMEKAGTPNAGLYDQRLVLEWVQQYIDQVGGDKSQVSAWGESAGAGSILHHLVQKDGTTPPLFSKAILQSPAFEWLWDRSGTLNCTYTNFSKLAGCETGDIACLRAFPLDKKTLTDANQNLILDTYGENGLFPLGPSVDGSLIKRLPVNSFYNDEYYDGSDFTSIIVSHVYDEASIFVPKWIKTDDDFTTFVSDFMPQPTLSSARSAIASQYPSASYSSPSLRAGAVIRDSTFMCNTRQLFDAYQARIPTYMMQYAVFQALGAAVHGTDLAPTFWNADVDFATWLYDMAKQLGHPITMQEANVTATFFGGSPYYYAKHYQSYLVSHAVHGDPNKGMPTNVVWPTATPTTSGQIGNVLQAQLSTRIIPPKVFEFETIADAINTPAGCDFWKNLASSIDPTPTTSSAPFLREQSPHETPTRLDL